jgi:hypothetical protein
VKIKRHKVIQPDDPTIRLIPLTQGQNAIVSVEDYERLTQWNWHAAWARDTKSFYAARWRGNGKEGSKRIWMHKEVLLTNGQVDHKNHDSLDNRRLNLRKCTGTQNNWNMRQSRRNTSGVKGVWRKGSKWEARIGVNKKKIYLGSFATLELAAGAYRDAAEKYCGEFALPVEQLLSRDSGGTK